MAIRSANTTGKRTKVFIQYSQSDVTFADALNIALTRKAFLVLMDRRDIVVEDWGARLETLFIESDVVLRIRNRHPIDSPMQDSPIYQLVGDTAEERGKRSVCVSSDGTFGANNVRFENGRCDENDLTALELLLNDDIERTREHTRLGELALRWVDRGQPADFLLRGLDLTEAEAWLNSYPNNLSRREFSFEPTVAPAHPTLLHREFIGQSRLEQKKAGARRLMPIESQTAIVSEGPRPMGRNIFISYRRSDARHIAGRIFDRLQAEFPPAEIFFDVDTIPIGVNFREHIGAAMSESAVVLAVIGDSWLKPGQPRRWYHRGQSQEDFVLLEIQLAIEFNLPIIPILVDAVSMPERAVLPAVIREFASFNAARARSGREFHADMDEIILLIKSWREQAVARQR
jgi:hypothetical protein